MQLITVATESMAGRGAVIEIKRIFLVNGGVWDGNWAPPTVGVSCVTSGTRASKVVASWFEVGLGGHRSWCGQLGVA